MRTIKEVRDADVPLLKAVVSQDKHVLLAPSFLVEKAGEIVGYTSVGAIPLVIVWMRTSRANGRDSFETLTHAEECCKRQGAGLVCVPCAETSPMHRYMTRLGYINFGTHDIFIKPL